MIIKNNLHEVMPERHLNNVDIKNIKFNDEPINHWLNIIIND